MKWLLPPLWALPGAAHAEVMDKMPSLPANVLGGLAAIAAMYLCARFKPWALLIVLPAACLWFGAIAVETLDPFIGPAIYAEAGPLYAAAPWAALAGICVGAAAGSWRRRRIPTKSCGPDALGRAG